MVVRIPYFGVPTASSIDRRAATTHVFESGFFPTGQSGPANDIASFKAHKILVVVASLAGVVVRWRRH